MDISKLNKETAANQRAVDFKSSQQYRKEGAVNAFYGHDEAVYNHYAQWAGFQGNSAYVKADGVTHRVHQINGFRGLAYGSPVVLRISKGFKTADFS